MQQGGGMEMIFILIIFGAIFYFMIYRPQAKRQKQQRDLLASLTKGDEVLTSGGLIGKITKVTADNDNIVIALNDTTEVTIKRDFVVAVLPKGSLKSL
ncbi:TPA: preprotein translocase subunit YajC [Mannheimia haemolytica]|uniref:Sec translocon accessory complex subunit YajC n=1 Tax=Mannheimia haemolytica TaxID=75985 RepID=A0A249A173_MANHA|nr:preprotein translocase subunit YajC [Mannheimia haemolytica]AWW72035.1 preprotein translocase subunit YajC [Pasteurellaceae bacterium 12565]AGI33317.1 preprotein translocase subunit YajC [Mannheimia haemolytica USDA-ARS-USMARC-183]AGI34720.1 preprotein translocase subunit YajC [Mannheimia haemolytica USDA-ARS-USMARC-185]AGK01766.1 YajC-like protein [Mannheimia haemolytica M42548]AGQ26568.1 preprotein translocase subunit YajC [Mannheimia haemolytica D153]